MCEAVEGDMFGKEEWANVEEQERRKEEQEEEDSEGHRPKYKVVSDKPSKREVEEHMLTHIPFRDWCPHCVRGKSKATPHRKRKEGEDEEVPVISVDYMFMETEDKDAGRGMHPWTPGIGGPSGSMRRW